MSSLAGPSSHTPYSSFPAHSQQPTAISTKLRRVADGESTPSSATPPPTVPPTPVVRAQSVAETEGREGSHDRQINGAVEPDPQGNNHTKSEPQQDVKASVIADLDAVRARAAAWSRKHGRTIEEEAAMVQTAARVASRLAEDHRAALFPDVETPFVDEVDVVKRLLPYHIFQQPKEDLEAVLQSGSMHLSRKGKRKATEEDLLREEIADTKFALECWRRRRALEKRFRKARIEAGKRASPDDQACFLAQAVLEVERADTAALQQELRAARQELDKIEREKRLAAPPPAATATASASRPTMNIRTANYYKPTAAPTPTQTSTTATFMPPYRPYSYSYSQYPTTQYTYNPHAYNATSYASTTTTSYDTTSHPVTAASTPTYTPPATSAASTPTSAASAQAQQTQVHPSAASNAAIPVQLPVSSLNALKALGIIPIDASATPPAGQSPPPAVIKSTTGNVLNLEINLSLLQSAQMSGLALILNALTSRGVDGSSATAAGVVPATAAPAASQSATSSDGITGTVTAPAPMSAATAAASLTRSSHAAAASPTSSVSGLSANTNPVSTASSTSAAAASAPASSASTSLANAPAPP
ncbi:hypothetical protein BD414DRAFT_412277 [Trametes punicea]|nr:hypothetical protein BD414DRAFT_412277 [Trametes punicea]